MNVSVKKSEGEVKCEGEGDFKVNLSGRRVKKSEGEE